MLSNFTQTYIECAADDEILVPNFLFNDMLLYKFKKLIALIRFTVYIKSVFKAAKQRHFQESNQTEMAYSVRF